ncbi:hypothetical protein ACVW00_001380 [Marmoricola sp. URHA0025 HA25]
MNADQARPLAAFWLLAIAAAVITGAGLRANDRPASGPATSPAHVNPNGVPEVVLGGHLQVRSGAVLMHPLSPELWSPGPVAGPTTAAVQVASPSTVGTTQKARAGSDGAPGSSAVGGNATSPSASTSTAEVTATAAPHGKGHAKAHETATPTPTGTPTGTPTATPTGTAPGAGIGKGRPAGP